MLFSPRRPIPLRSHWIPHFLLVSLSDLLLWLPPLPLPPSHFHTNSASNKYLYYKNYVERTEVHGPNWNNSYNINGKTLAGVSKNTTLRIECWVCVCVCVHESLYPASLSVNVAVPPMSPARFISVSLSILWRTTFLEFHRNKNWFQLESTSQSFML